MTCHTKKPRSTGTSVDGDPWPKDARKPCKEVEVPKKKISENISKNQLELEWKIWKNGFWMDLDYNFGD